MLLPHRQHRKEQSRKVAALFLLFVIACIGTMVPKSSSLPLVFTFAFVTAGTSRTTASKQNPKQTFQKGLQQQKLVRFFPLFSTDDSFNTQQAATTTKSAVSSTANGASSAQVRIQRSEASSVVAKKKNKSMFDKFRKASNCASLLCVLDCTLLPVVTVGLPLLGVVHLSTAKLQMIDKLGHSLALFFVLPVGSLTTTINYRGHRKKWIASMALFGILLVGIANSHWHLPHSWPAMLIGAIHNMQSCGCHPSIWHRLANVGGCALLLGSNYISQKQEGCAAHKITGTSNCCSHDHTH